MKTTLLFLALILLGLTPAGPPISWQRVDNGLYLTHYDSPVKSTMGDSKITILKIDPAVYQLKMACRSQYGGPGRTVQQWAQSQQWLAVINAGMFMGNGMNCGFMKNYIHVNNGSENHGNAMLVFNRINDDVADVQILDRQCQSWDNVKSQYYCMTQSIRMVDCQQANCWASQDKMWSTACIGMDKSGNILFIFCRSPYQVHTFIDILLKAPIDLYNLMYLEGGPAASFYLDHNGITSAKVGSYETGIYEWDDNHEYMALPNVIGISKR